MAAWAKEEIVLSNGERVSAQAPVIVSASRSTDIPAFYADWFMERMRAGCVKWYNPFTGVPLYVSFNKARLFVFWSKNPAPMLAKLPGRDESPIDILEREGRNYYFIDIKAYAKVAKNLERGGIAAHEFTHEEMLEIAEGIAAMTREWKMEVGTCGEPADLPASA